jgi:hypothetical protein
MTSDAQNPDNYSVYIRRPPIIGGGDIVISRFEVGAKLCEAAGGNIPAPQA